MSRVSGIPGSRGGVMRLSAAAIDFDLIGFFILTLN